MEMTDGKLNQTAQRQQEDRKKRLAEALRANIALRKNRVRSSPVSEPQSTAGDAAIPDQQDS
jgi:hypothetical protein